MQTLEEKLISFRESFKEDAKQRYKYITDDKKTTFRELKESQIETIDLAIANAAKNIEHIETYGQPMPFCFDLEECVLGAIIVDRSAFCVVKKILSPDDFYINKHGIIFCAMQELHAQGGIIDLITLSEKLKNKVSVFDLIELTNRVASSANAEYHCRILLQYAYRRKLIMACMQTIKSAFGNEIDVFELFDAIKLIEPCSLAQHKTAQQ